MQEGLKIFLLHHCQLQLATNIDIFHFPLLSQQLFLHLLVPTKTQNLYQLVTKVILNTIMNKTRRFSCSEKDPLRGGQQQAYMFGLFQLTPSLTREIIINIMKFAMINYHGFLRFYHGFNYHGFFKGIFAYLSLGSIQCIIKQPEIDTQRGVLNI